MGYMPTAGVAVNQPITGANFSDFGSPPAIAGDSSLTIIPYFSDINFIICVEKNPTKWGRF